jgi:Fibronectin type III domain
VRRIVVSRAVLIALMFMGLFVAVPSAAIADGSIAAPDAPTGIFVSESGVKDPTDFSKGYDLTLTWTASVEHGTPVTAYDLELSTDGGATWSPDPDAATTTDTDVTVSRAPAGQAWLYRVFADSAAGRSARTTPLTVATPGTGTHTQRFVIRTRTGAPLTNGDITWSDGYGTWSRTYHLTADGVVDLPDIPAGWGYSLRMNDAYLRSGVEIQKEWSVDVGTAPQTLIVPAPPAKQVRTIHVVMPGGVPVIDAEVDLFHYDGMVNSIVQDGFIYNDISGSHLSGNTDSTGTAVLTGWSAEGVQFIPAAKYPYPEQAAEIYYNDGTLHQEEVALLDGAQTTIELDPMPWLTAGRTRPTSPSRTTAVSFAAHAVAAAGGTRTASAARLGGIKVRLKAPSGWSAKKCSLKPVLKGVTDKSGRIKLSVCGVKSGVFKVLSSGAVPTGAVTLRVKHAPALPPSRVIARSTAHGQLVATWTRPAYDGGAVISSYRVTARASGQQARTRTITHATALRSGLVSTFHGLKRAARWTVSVRVITKYGVSSPRSASVRTA